MSTFVKKVIRVDNNLSRIIGVNEGLLVSYAEITKGIYDYVKRHNLKMTEAPSTKGKSFCFRCGNNIDIKSKYCDKCGAKQ